MYRPFPAPRQVCLPRWPSPSATGSPKGDVRPVGNPGRHVNTGPDQPGGGTAGIVERLVPDELWELFQRVVPQAPSRPQGGGRRRHGDRGVAAAIVSATASGCTWRQLPAASFGPSGAMAHRRFAEWTKARVWAKLHRLVLDELGSRGELDWSRCAIDSVNMRVLRRGA